MYNQLTDWKRRDAMGTQYNFNRIWSTVKRTVLRRFVQDEHDLPLAFDLSRRLWVPRFRLAAQAILGIPLMPVLHGSAGYGYESRRWLNPETAGEIATTGANTNNFNVNDFFRPTVVGVVWTTAGTVTALVADFDKYTRPLGAGTVTDKLDATNGTITAPSIVASQAIGRVVFKDLSNYSISLNPGNSVQFIVTTTTTAGGVIPFVLGIPNSDVFANLSTATASS